MVRGFEITVHSLRFTSGVVKSNGFLWIIIIGDTFGDLLMDWREDEVQYLWRHSIRRDGPPKQARARAPARDGHSSAFSHKYTSALKKSSQTSSFILNAQAQA